MHTYLTRSRFCLVPAGEGFGCRLAELMITGCVPVIIQPGVIQPFEDILPYSEFSLRYAHADIPTLHEKLAAISPARHGAMRAAGARHAAAFNWREDGSAYEHTRYTLCLRAGVPCEHLRPAALRPVRAASARRHIPRAARAKSQP